MQDTFNLFADLLNERFARSIVTTEDSVRYTFFHALLLSDRCKHTDVILELKHPTISNAEIDTIIQALPGHPSVAVEFKYDRKNPSKKNYNSTNHAGAIFNDLFRLARIPDTVAQVRYFVYLTDGKMAAYFQNPHNELHHFFDFGVDQPIVLDTRFALNRANTFQKRIINTQIECSVNGELSRRIAATHELRIYQVLAS